MSLKVIATALVFIAATQAQATAARGLTAEEEAVASVTKAVVANDLKFKTTPTQDVCDHTGLAGTDVKVIVKAKDRYVVIRHYGVTYPNQGQGVWAIFRGSETIECAQ